MRKTLLTVLLLSTGTILSHAQVNINATVQINGFRHNWDCGNDGVLGDNPDPRFKVWTGWNAANFVPSTSGPGIFAGCTDVYGADAVSCSVWNPGLITAAVFTNQPMNQINIDMESWEDDGCGSNCGANTCGFPTFNSDDTRCGRLRIGDIDFWQQPPCQNNTYNGQFTSGNFLSMHNRCSDNNGAGYGINQLIVNWNFASAPTITSQPTPLDRTLCLGTGTTLTVGVNSWNGWSLARQVQWQVSSNTDCASPGTWTNIPGATSLSYVPPQTPGTFLYRCVISSHCSDINQQQVISSCVRVTYHPYGAPLVSTACGTTIVPGVPYQFCTTLPPNPNASVNMTDYLWTVSPAAGVTISNPNSSCTNITFTNQGAYTITLSYIDACGSFANATATCVTTVNPPACDMIYVDGATGNDANLGYSNAPVQTLRRAMQLVGGGRTNIRMTGGTYTEPRIIRMASNVVIDGRWQNSAGTWTKNSSLNTIINFTTSDSLIGVNNAIKCGFMAQSVNNWTLQDLVIATPSATGTSTDGRGRTNYGVLIDNCTGYTIVRCSVQAGSGAPGANGTNGGTGANGTGGGNGNGATCGANDNSGKAGGTAGTGGVNAWGNNGGNGGTGGNTTGGSGANAGNTGINGVGSTAGGGGSVGTGSGNCITNSTAGAGGPGGGFTTTVVSTAGVNGGTAANTAVYGAFYITSGQGSQGGHGNSGSGGGGGGGSRGQNGSFISCVSNSGNSGGGGGGGGGGGQGGFGGWGGGGSFAIYRNNSGTTNAPFIDVMLITGTGGTGGAGGIGGNGGTGGGGGTGNNTCSGERGTGGNGGAGGNGARGGTGQIGATGNTALLYTVGVGATNPSTSIPNPYTIIMNHQPNAKGCVNSEISLNTSAGGTPWTLTSSAIINDVNSSTSTMTYSSNPVTVFYTGTGNYDIGVNGGSVYQDWIKIIDGTRPASVSFTITSSPVCSGNTFTVSAPAYGTELQWEWVLFTTSALVPVQTVTTQTATFTAPVVATPTVYNIRYRVRENCCGWSRPYYTSVTVNPVATAVAPADNYVCEGTAFNLAGASATGYNPLLWTTNGDGTFSNASIVAPTYTPGPNDVTNGSVTLTITSTAYGGCTNASDQVVLTVRPTGEWLGVQNTPVNDNWNNNANWCGGIPTPTTNALIPTTPLGPFWPVIGAGWANVQDLTLENGTTITWYQNNVLDVYRDLYNYGATINTNQGMTRFVGGTNNGNVGGSSATDFYNMQVNKTGGTQMNITANQRVYNNLDMVMGDINIQNPYYLELGTNALSPGTLSWNTTNQPTIIGWFRRWFGATTNSGSTTGLFPVGNVQSSTVYNRWLLMEWTGAPGTGGHLTTRFVGVPASFYNGLPLTDLLPTPQLLQNFANEGYWEVNPGGGLTGGSYTLTLRANNFTTINTLANTRIIKSVSPHVIWSLDGVHGSIVGPATDFTISRTGMSNFSFFTIASDNNNPLPVELAFFNASCKSGKVELAWATYSEQNNQYFSVERSIDGMSWTEIDRVTGAGNSNQLINYSYTDNAPWQGVSYYRITQVDFDGSSETFNPYSVNCLISGGNSAMLYPNPATQEVTLYVYLDRHYGAGTVRFTDMMGRTIRQMQYELQEGENKWVISGLDALAPGTYNVLIASETLNLPVQKLIIR